MTASQSQAWEMMLSRHAMILVSEHLELRAATEQGTGHSNRRQVRGNKSRGYTKARTTQPVRRFNKAEYNLQEVVS